MSVRVKLPVGQGLHPAVWLLGTDISSVGYPNSGEIDIVETINQADRWTTGIHGPSASGLHWKLNQGGSMPSTLDGFHIFSVTRAPGSITMAVDGIPVVTYAPDMLSPGQLWVFDKPMYLLINLAVGGTWPGPLDPAVLPARMEVDWIRYQP